MPIDLAKLKIVHYPHPVLRRKAKPIGEITNEVRAVADRMVELMDEANGVGLAAPQVGLEWRMFVTCVTRDPDDTRIFINPKLSSHARDQEEYEEGCLSLPNLNALIRRPIGITIDALDLQGQPFTLSSDELDARVWQHEYDHLDGVLIIDRMSQIDRIGHRDTLKQLETAATPTSPPDERTPTRRITPLKRKARR